MISDFLLGLWVVLIILYFLSSLYFFYLQKTAIDERERRMVLFLAFFMFLFLALSRLFHIISYLNNDEQFTLTLSQIFVYSTIITIIFYFEKRVLHSKYFILTLIMIILSIIYFIFRHIYLFNIDNPTFKFLDNFTANILSYYMIGIVLIGSLLYLRISFQTSGIVRRKSLIISVGIILLLVSYCVYLLDDIVDESLLSFISFLLSISSIPFLVLGYK